MEGAGLAEPVCRTSEVDHSRHKGGRRARLKAQAASVVPPSSGRHVGVEPRLWVADTASREIIPVHSIYRNHILFSGTFDGERGQ